MGQHINAMKAGTFDGGYTLEPNASVMNQMGFAKTVEAGVIAKYILNDPEADPFCRRLRVLVRFYRQAARRRQTLCSSLGEGAGADRERSPGRAQAFTQEHPDAGKRRRYHSDARLRHGERHDGKADRRLAEFADFGHEIGVVPEKVDVKKYLQPF